jgi:hypothetical protein
MSSLTREQIGIVARRRTGAPVSERPRYEALLDDALKSLARKVARRDDYTELRKQISVTCTGGVITLADDSVLYEVLAATGQLYLNNSPVKFVPRREDLNARLPADAYWGAVENRKVYVKDITTGSLGAANQTGTLDANYAPTLAQYPPNYDEELIDEVVRLATGRAEAAPARDLDGGKEEGLNVNFGADD